MTPDEQGHRARVRVRVTSPRVAASRTRHTSIASEIDAQTELGEVYVTSLMRTQLRLALGIVLLLGCTLGAVPLALQLVPALRVFDVLGVPLPWLVLGVLAYVEVVVLGRLYVRHAERNEQSFSDLLEPR